MAAFRHMRPKLLIEIPEIGYRITMASPSVFSSARKNRRCSSPLCSVQSDAAVMLDARRQPLPVTRGMKRNVQTFGKGDLADNNEKESRKSVGAQGRHFLHA